MASRYLIYYCHIKNIINIKIFLKHYLATSNNIFDTISKAYGNIYKIFAKKKENSSQHSENQQCSMCFGYFAYEHILYCNPLSL